MTDGILLRELGSGVSKGGDLLLSQYSCIIIDEAHERTVGTDILIGWLTRIAKLRNNSKIKGAKPLKLVIMSATLRVEDFTGNQVLFPDQIPPVVKVDGRQHKVVVHYNKTTPEMDYISEALKKVVKIHTRLPHGGVLVFVTGQQEVMILCKKLAKLFPAKGKSLEFNDLDEKPDSSFFGNDHDDSPIGHHDNDVDDFELDSDTDSDEEEETQVLNGTVDEELAPLEKSEIRSKAPLHVLPLYSLLSTKDQMRVFEPPPEGSRLVVIATNVAETSLTIPGIKYVVDCGKAKERCYDTQTGIENFRVQWTSKASADQRAGRAGRVGPGHCYRLFSSAVFDNYFQEFSRPEIQRIPIQGVVLSMKSMGINNVVGFPFPTRPDAGSLKDAELLLKHLGALDFDNKITNTGKLMSQLPVQPRYSKMLVTAAQRCPELLGYVVAIVAGLSVGEIFYRDLDLILDKKPKKEEAEEDQSDESEEEAEDKDERRQKRTAFFKKMMVFAGSSLSDPMTVLKAVGAYIAELSSNRSIEKFCSDNYLRPKAMDEVIKLMSQLRNIAKTISNVEISSRLIPPTATQEILLKQVLLSGYVDCVAKLDLNVQSGHGKHALPVYQTIWSNNTENFVIHPASSVFRHRPAPTWIIFDQLQAKQEIMGPDGTMIELRGSSDEVQRKWLKGVTVIKDEWISRLDWFVSRGSILEQPEPKYNAKRDVVLGYISPTFGPKAWTLPVTEKEMTLDGVPYFARALLEGKVNFGFSNHSCLFTIVLVFTVN